MSAQSKMGRPPLAEGKARAVVFTVRLSPEEREEIAAAAERDGKPVTQWARDVLLASAGPPWRIRLEERQ